MVKKCLFFLFYFGICNSVFASEIDKATFFSAFPDTYICQGTKEVFNEPTEKLGKIQVSITGKAEQNPVVQVVSADKRINFKIGDGFLASSDKYPSNCSYLFLNGPLRMFYVCGLEIKDSVMYQQMMRADERVSFSQNLICTGGSICIRMSDCK